MAKIIVQKATSDGWQDQPDMGTHDTTAAAKSAIGEKAEPGPSYRVLDVKWEGKVAERDDTIIRKK